MDSIFKFFSHFIEPDPKTALLVVLNLVLIEGLLSVDNAAVLATMVKDLPFKDRNRALRIGLLFAYVFRGLALLFASLLIKVGWLKLAGGAYLVYLCAGFYYKRLFKKSGPETAYQQPARLIPGLSLFWSTVIMVELMDLTFSIDNVFAAVALTKNIHLVYLGVFIGIIAMRIVAGYFVKLMHRFPFLEGIAFLIIGILGLRLCMEFACTLAISNNLCHLLDSEVIDLVFSVLTVGLFVLPIVTSVLFNVPRRQK